MHRFIKSVVVFAVAVLGGAAAAADLTGLDRYLQGEMQQRRIPGLQLAVVQAGKIVLLKSYGTAEIPNSVPVGNGSVFSINSATKTFTGVAAMQLVDAGKLDVAAPVSRYLADLPAPWRGVTITQLLDHTSGIPNIISDETSALVVPDDVEAAWRLVQTLPMEFKPGERFSYNQTNYMLLGKVIDHLSGQPFAQFMQRRQFDAVRMPHTGFGDARDVIPHKAPSYRMDKDGKTLRPIIDDFPEQMRTGAGLNSSAEDLAHWIIALQSGKLVSKAGLARLWTRGQYNDGAPGRWALGWPAIGQGEYRAVAGIGGARSAFYVYPDQDLAVVILTNLSGASPEQMIDTVAGYFLPGLKRARAGG